jgi:hypothetical protein
MFRQQDKAIFRELQGLHTCNGYFSSKKLKLKVARLGLYGTAALCIADCALAPNVVPSFISRGATIPSGAGALY